MGSKDRGAQHSAFTSFLSLWCLPGASDKALGFSLSAVPLGWVEFENGSQSAGGRASVLANTVVASAGLRPHYLVGGARLGCLLQARGTARGPEGFLGHKRESGAAVPSSCPCGAYRSTSLRKFPLPGHGALIGHFFFNLCRGFRGRVGLGKGDCGQRGTWETNHSTAKQKHKRKGSRYFVTGTFWWPNKDEM